ncbi:unnamed protein product, partial [Prorocentrum cordatum]
VSFQIELNASSGKQQAINVTGAGQKGDVMKGDGKGCGKVAAPFGANGCNPAGPPVPPAEMKSGVVVSWNPEKGFGFVDPEDGTENVFIHRSALTDGNMLELGSRVQFVLEWNPNKSKTQGKSVTGAKGDPTQGPGAQPTDGSGEPQQATVKLWFEDKGFGFVVLPSGN